MSAPGIVALRRQLRDLARHGGPHACDAMLILADALAEAQSLVWEADAVAAIARIEDQARLLADLYAPLTGETIACSPTSP